PRERAVCCDPPRTVGRSRCWIPAWPRLVTEGSCGLPCPLTGRPPTRGWCVRLCVAWQRQPPPPHPCPRGTEPSEPWSGPLASGAVSEEANGVLWGVVLRLLDVSMVVVFADQ